MTESERILGQDGSKSEGFRKSSETAPSASAPEATFTGGESGDGHNARWRMAFMRGARGRGRRS